MIKLFEEYNQYYNVIEEEKFYDLCGINQENNTLTFSDDEINILSKEVKDINLINNKKYISMYTYITMKSNIDNTIVIYKIPDEWYLVAYIVHGEVANGGRSYMYYKCDQIEGLIKFIKDIYDKNI